eukprot:TRINITY_DN65072_c0_g4_i1.p1 TRINITY_DN65072_c0_g4~~TRINITY_DN65072_c0_g4_i1.p1  ORF type:complete len:386 (-),score=34.98 TRINITY_DN65072_c0_g4_i1:40-1197(-)
MLGNSHHRGYFDIGFCLNRWLIFVPFLIGSFFLVTGVKMHHPYQHNRGGRPPRITACSCVIDETDPNEPLFLLIQKQHSAPYRDFFQLLMQGDGQKAQQKLHQISKAELESILRVCDNPAVELERLFTDVFGRNPSWKTKERKWKSANPPPWQVFQQIPVKTTCATLLQTTQNFPAFWEFPGGDVGRGEDPALSATREAKEETGFDVVPHPVYHKLNEQVHWGPNGQNTNNMTVCALKEGCSTSAPTSKADDVEVQAVKWMNFEDCLAHMRDPKNVDYPNFLKKAYCFLCHKQFQTLKVGAMSKPVWMQLETLHARMKKYLLDENQAKQHADMEAQYNKFKFECGNTPTPEQAQAKEQKKQDMLSFVLRCVEKNANKPAGSTLWN